MKQPVDAKPPTHRSRALVRGLLGLAVAAVPATALVLLWQATAGSVEPASREVVDASSPALEPTVPWPAPGVGLPPAPPPTAANATAAGMQLQATVSYRGDGSTLAPEARAYVFVRRIGERMPLGVERLTVAELPARVTFSGLDPSAPLEVVARLSRSGNVTFDPGDIEVVVPAADAGADASVELILAADRMPAERAPGQNIAR
ncbi:MAG: hypothetical protein RIC56_02290 [Pseudomonadales bacterium]